MAPLRIAILWHMHQPNYQEPGGKQLLLPWVRLHAIKDYLDMPLRAAADPRLKVTFNLVPSLLDQLELYGSGGSDRYLDLVTIPAEELSIADKRDLLASGFQANPARMIEPYPRYLELYRKFQQTSPDNPQLISLFSSSELRDIQVWSTLCWVDELFRADQPIRSLLAKGRHFSEEDKAALLLWQSRLLASIIPTYQELFTRGAIDISFTPYYHPILPLLCDTQIAREATPDISLPARFVHPEDARAQIRMSQRRFADLFGQPLAGMWPSEGSVSEAALSLMSEAGIRWAASDEEVLYQSLRKSSAERMEHALYQPYHHNGLTLFFRDHLLSDRIGFVYSGWPADRAVDDFISHLKSIRIRFADRLDSLVVPVILDGENCWEYYENDGHEFLTLLYRQIAEDPALAAVSCTDAASSQADPLPRIFAGSWINHNFRIWIGHEEDNAAWELLLETRTALTSFLTSNPDCPFEVRERAWKQIYIAEGSDWCWWYGEDHVGPHNSLFDEIFRTHLIAVYKLINQPIPDRLTRPISGAWPARELVRPEGLVTPTLDGRLTHFYEWSGAALFDCQSGSSMHRVDRRLAAIYFAFDRHDIYLRIDMLPVNLPLTRPDRLVLRMTSGAELSASFSIQPASTAQLCSQCSCVIDQFAEIAIPRSALLTGGAGQVSLAIGIERDGHEIERFPETGSLQLEIPPVLQELFWPV